MPKMIMILIGFLLVGAGSVQAAPVGVAVSVHGDAWVLYGQHKKALHKGDSVRQYETIITGSKGRVRLLMKDKSRVYLSPRSRLKLKYYEVKKDSLVLASFKMFWGKVRYFVNKLPSGASSFKVNTRTAVLGVRGTEFDVGVPMPDGVDAFDPNLTMEQLPPVVTSVDMFSGVVVLTDSQGGTHQLVKGTSTTVDAEGNVSQVPLEANDAVTKPAAAAEEAVEAPGADTTPVENVVDTQVINQVSNTAGVGTSVIQGSTIATPYDYRFGGR